MKDGELYLATLSESVILVSPWMVRVTLLLGLMIRCDLCIYRTFWSFRVLRQSNAVREHEHVELTCLQLF